MKTEDKIRLQVEANPILLYMKGSPARPECGFSAKAAAALKSTGVDFAYIDVLQNPFIREKLPSVSRWPTYPQLFVAGELVGGADLIKEMNLAGQLKPLLESAGKAKAEA